MKKFLILLFFLTSCFGGVDKRGSVTSYRPGLVMTEGGSFKVGELSSDWQKKDLGYRAAIFGNEKLQASLGVDSFCKGSFNDAPLSLLAKQLTYGMTQVKKRKETNLRLENREALRSVTSGALDGAPIILDTVVLKMNECVFDFFYTSSPDDYANGVGEFEKFFKGFRYLRGPSIDK